MRFINPKTDLAFKKIFGSEGSKPILISFLNAILHQGEPVIVDLEIVDPYSIPRLEGMKDTFLDVRATLSDGEHVIIEMQVLNVAGLEKRILYNAAKEYANQLQKGDNYSALNPVIALTIADFVMFDRQPELVNQIISRFALIEKEQMVSYPDGDVELVFVELPKFQLEVDELTTLTEKWLYFLKAAPDLEIIPENLEAIPEIREAFQIAEYSRLSTEEENALQKKIFYIATQKSLEKQLQTEKEKFAAAKDEAEAAKDEAEAAKDEAEAAKNEAEAARNAAIEESKRVRMLEKKLQELGIDPDVVDE